MSPSKYIQCWPILLISCSNGVKLFLLECSIYVRVSDLICTSLKSINIELLVCCFYCWLVAWQLIEYVSIETIVMSIIRQWYRYCVTLVVVMVTWMYFEYSFVTGMRGLVSIGCGSEVVSWLSWPRHLVSIGCGSEVVSWLSWPRHLVIIGCGKKHG